MVGESQSAPLRLLNPLPSFPQTREKNASPKVLNLVNFRVVELVEAFTLWHPNYFFRKVVVLSNFPCMVCVMCVDGKLHVCTTEDKNWNIMDLDYNETRYRDIIIHKGHVYILDSKGTIFWIDPSSLKLVQYSPSRYSDYGFRKEMVECNGSLYVVDIIHIQVLHIQERKFEACIEVYKLDEEWGRWENVKNLGDVLFVLGNNYNFSLSAQDYYGCKGNCIYFAFRNTILCFSLEDSKLELHNPLWPCPTLFNPKFNL
ncbi:F-box protein At2g26160-like [Lotus japonicus]|uniref:F-box protein At2g26160-like n=1 Tax=Lotus japonicus TaxID=34305 RepID=UPI00258C19A4|nr:F-box protein At2g26160-like [Lotus japonicus]